MKLVTLEEISEYRREYCNHCKRDTVFELKAPWQDRGDGIKRFLYTCTTQLGIDPITHKVIICGDTQTIGVHYGQQDNSKLSFRDLTSEPAENYPQNKPTNTASNSCCFTSNRCGTGSGDIHNLEEKR